MSLSWPARLPGYHCLRYSAKICLSLSTFHNHFPRRSPCFSPRTLETRVGTIRSTTRQGRRRGLQRPLTTRQRLTMRPSRAVDAISHILGDITIFRIGTCEVSLALIFNTAERARFASISSQDM